MKRRWGTTDLVLAAVAFAPWLSPLEATTQERSTDDPIAIVGGILIDGTGSPPIVDAVVVVEGDRILEAGPASSVVVPDGAHVIRADGKTIMPGLADMHVHLMGGWDGVRTDMLGYQRYLDGLLYAGVTTILDTGNVLPYIAQIRSELEAGRLRGPRVLMSGPVIDGPDPVWPPISYAVGSTAQIAGIVAQLKAAGVDVLKGYGGLSIPMVQTLVAEGTEAEIQVVVDHWAQNGSIDLIRAGVTAFTHLPGSPVSDPALDAMVQGDVAFLSTLAVLESFSRDRFDDLEFLGRDLVRNSNPDWALQELRAHAQRPLDGDRAAAAERAGQRLAAAQANLVRLHDRGILIAAGTDAPYPGVFLGEGIHREMELMVDAGLSPVQAIQAATGSAARFVGQEQEWGTVESGRRADLVIVDGRPGERISDTRRIDTVIQRGVVLDRGALAYDPARDPGFRASSSVSN